MDDDWFYSHQGTIGGPTPITTLRLMALEGKLAGTDAVWSKGASPATAVLARTVVPFSEGAVPDWLGDVQTAEGQPRIPTHPDWLEGVRLAEKAEAASGVGARIEPTPVVKPVSPPSGPNPPPLLPVAIPVAALAVSSPTTKAIGSPLPAGRGDGKLEIGSATSPGMARPRNEDSFLVLQSTWANLDRRHEMAIVVVADGMGGHQSGERASGLLIGVMGKALAPLLTEAVLGSAGTILGALPHTIDIAFSQAHQVVSEAGNADARCKGMGATGVALVLLDDNAHLGLVGDCRVYHQRGTQLTQVTRDQTIVARMVELGHLTPEEAVNHPRANEVTQAIGLRSAVQPVKSEQRLLPGDWLIACCDGLYAHVEDSLLQETISQWGASADGLAHHLVELANQRGGSDNCTVVAVRCNGA